MRPSAALRFSALVATSGVLLADECDNGHYCCPFADFRATIDYALDCRAGDSGTLDIAVVEKTGCAWPVSSDVKVMRSGGRATFVATDVNTSSSGCFDAGPGADTLTSLSFRVTLKDDEGRPDTWDCVDWEPALGDQTLFCDPIAYSGGVECLLTLSETDTGNQGN
jgi:hypothetical protein